MGKKKSKKSRKKVVQEEIPEDVSSDNTLEVDSVITSSTEEVEQEGQNWVDDLMEGIDLLSNKRTETRIKALKLIKKILRAHVSNEVLQNHVQSLMKSLLSIFNRGGKEEEILASEILSIMIITFGYEFSEDYDLKEKLKSTFEAKSRVGEVAHKDPEVRIASLNALSMCMFILDDVQEFVMKDGSLDKLQTLFWKDKEPQVLASAIQGWTLLASGLHNEVLVYRMLPKVKRQLVRFLEHSVLEVRTAAGEALALLYEAYYEEDVEEKDVELKDILERVEILSKESTKRKSKKEKSIQHATFRDILATLEDGTAPSIKSTMKKTTITFDNWKQVIQFNHFRQRLGSGIVEHFKENELVRDVFDVAHIQFDNPDVRKMTGLEKRFVLSKNAPIRKYETTQRHKKTRQFGQFVTSEY